MFDDRYEIKKEHHVLLIDDCRQMRAVVLTAATYSIGRDVNNSIIIPNSAISREHALLLRVPVSGTTHYQYQIVDGNIDGHPSINGIEVNGHNCDAHMLKKGDAITLGGVIKVAYFIVTMNQAEVQELFPIESINIQRVKQPKMSPDITETLPC